MSALPLIAELADKGINIRVEGSELVLSAPKGTLTPELVCRVKEEKPALLASLSNQIFASEEDFSLCLLYRQGESVVCVDMLARRLWRHHYDELGGAAGDAWALISTDPDKLFDFMLAEATRQILRSGRIPDTKGMPVPGVNE